MRQFKISSESKLLHLAVIGLSAGSGCAALVYEIVWLQMLELVLGSSSVSLGILLGTFMGGLCLGSLLLPYVVSNRYHPLWVYAALEIAIGIIGLALMLGTPWIGVIYAASAMQGIAGLLMRGAFCAALLLVPTALMGAALPCLARLMRATPEGMGRLGRLYASNIVGAIVGCVLAGFYLLRIYDMPTATYFAAAVNGTVALVSAVLALATLHTPPADRERIEKGARPQKTQTSSPWPVYLTIALSGLTALGAQVVWTRLLSLLLGPSVYTFSIILAVFLLGLGFGSAAASRLLRQVKDAGAALAVCQFLLAAAIAWSAFMIAVVVPFWPVDRTLAPSPWVNYQIDVLCCVWAILPATILWGASFPFALAAASSRQKDAGWIVGAVYASNTVGAILGALGASLILIPSIGTQRSQQLLIILAACGGLAMAVPLVRALRRASTGKPTAGSDEAGGKALGWAGAFVVAGLMIFLVPPTPPLLVEYGRDLLKFKVPKLLYMGEGVTSSVAVTEVDGRFRQFHVAGKVEASNIPADMRLERMLGHLSALLHPNPRSVLIVGFGAGITAGTFTLYPNIKRIVICDIEPLVPQKVGPYFKRENYDVLHDPRVKIVYDDARHFILTSKEKFDVITSDPIHPWVKGAANLYTREYFEQVKQHLNPGGVVTQWIPLYESTRATIKSELGTLFRVFPRGAIWANNRNGQSYDLVASGYRGPTKIDLDKLIERLNRPDYARVLASLREVHFDSVLDLFGTYLAQHGDITSWLADAQLNTDANLRLQYLAGFEYNRKGVLPLAQEIRKLRWLPPDFLVGTEARRRALFEAIEKGR